jgi:phage shock protein PspC (stress-responsive transcriptional regulator)
MTVSPIRRLQRRPYEGRVAGVCAGFAEYFQVDATLVRVLWIIFSIVPGMLVGGVLAYLLSWLVMPEAHPQMDDSQGPVRLMRSATDYKIAGVCGGLAEYLGTDATPIRLLWVLLTILPGAIVGGILVYLVMWVLTPRRPAGVLKPGTPSTAGSAV